MHTYETQNVDFWCLLTISRQIWRLSKEIFFTSNIRWVIYPSNICFVVLLITVNSNSIVIRINNVIFIFQTLFIFQKEMTFFWIHYACNFWRYFRHLIYKTYGSILPTDENIWPHQIWEYFVQKVWGIMLRLQNKFKSSSFLNDIYFNGISLYLCIYINTSSTDITLCMF